MKGIQRLTMVLVAGLAGAATSIVAPVSAQAQQVCRRQPPEDVMAVVVTTFRSPAGDRTLGVKAADEARERLAHEFSCDELLVRSKSDVERVLTASGYPTDVALNPTDAKQLATQLRADFYLTGSVRPAPGGVLVMPEIVLTRDPALVQPLDTVAAEDAGDAAKVVSRELEAAMKSLDDVRDCLNALRDGNNQGAVAAANRGIAQYANSTLARVCLATAYRQLGYPPDSILRVTSEALRLDPKSRIPLELAANAYEKLNNDQKAVETWTRLISLDPTNTQLVEHATGVLVRSGNAEAARPIIMQAVEENPNDLSLQRLKWLVLLTIRDWKEAIQTGEQLAQIDTSITDTTFFQRLTAAYAADSQPQKAAEAAARGLAKFPNSASLHLLRAQMLRQAGQLDQALAEAQRAVQIDSTIPRGFLQVAQINIELNRPDSAYRALTRAARTGDSTFIAQYALSLGNTMYKTAVASKNIDDYRHAVTFLQLSDELQASEQAKFLLGVSAFQIAQQAAQEAQKGKSCESAKLAQEHAALAQTNIAAGGRQNPEAAQQLLGYLPQLSSAINSQVKVYCK